MRALTKADKERGDKMRELGCIVCWMYLDVFTPPAIHHIDGKTKPGCHDLTIPLCPNHHQNKSNDGRWTSLHGDGRKAFAEAYNDEQWLLKITNELIGL
jgi:hypothetical protein